MLLILLAWAGSACRGPNEGQAAVQQPTATVPAPFSVARTTVADGQIFHPSGIAVDAQGNFYVTDSVNNRVQRFDAEGGFLNGWGSQGSGEGQFNEPNGIAVAADGTVYVVDTRNARIQTFTADGEFLGQWGSQGSGEGQFSSPEGLAVAGDGTVYVADWGNNRIQVFTADGDFIAWWGRAERLEPAPTQPAATLTQEASLQISSTPTPLSTRQGDSVVVQSGVEVTTVADTVPAPTLTQEARPQASATPPPLPTLVIEETVEMVCQEPPLEFWLFTALNIRRLAQLRFESAELVTFEGWTDRPEPTVLPRTPEPTVEPSMAVNSSSRMLLTGGQIDLSSGELDPRPLDVDAPLANPCGEACPLEVLGQSPNGQWQLVQVNDWLRAQMGLWLVSAETALRLVPYVPASPGWQWADDSSMLWLTYYFDEVGGATLVVRLDNPPAVHQSQDGGLLDPSLNWLGYSPADNTAFVVSVLSLWFGQKRTEQVFTVALDDDPETASGVGTIPGVVSVAWNEATRSMVAQLTTESGITFQELPGGLSLTIPNETLASLLPSFTNAAESLPNGISTVGEWAIAPAGEKVALLPNPAVIWFFDCVPGSASAVP